MGELRKCKACGEEKPLEGAFFQSSVHSGKRYYDSKCRICRAAFKRTRRRELGVCRICKERKELTVENFAMRIFGGQVRWFSDCLVCQSQKLNAATRKCRVCGEEKPLTTDHFRSYKRTRKPSGKDILYWGHECIPCANSRISRFYHENADWKRERTAELNRDPIRRLKRSERYKEYAKRDPEKFRRQRMAISKRYRAGHRAERRIRDHLKRARKLAAKIGTIKKKHISDLFDKQRGRCAICTTKLTMDTKHIDHIRPLSRGGAHCLDNLQILCPDCNMRKNASDPIEYMQKVGFLL